MLYPRLNKRCMGTDENFEFVLSHTAKSIALARSLCLSAYQAVDRLVDTSPSGGVLHGRIG
jgi:hypothetical protein